MKAPSSLPSLVMAASVAVAPFVANPAAAEPTKVGPEIAVNTAPGYLESAHVAADPAGNFLVVWADDSDETVRAQAFYSTGNSQGPIFAMSEDEHYVTEGSFAYDELVSVAADAAGNFVVAFNAYDTSSQYGQACNASPCIYTKRRDANGLVSPSTFIVGDPRLNPYQGETYNQTANPEIASDGDGNFIVVWEGYDEFDHVDHFDIDEGVWARKTVGSGQVNGAPFRVNGVTAGYQGDYGRLHIATDADSNFTVVWEDENYNYPPYSGTVMGRFDKLKNPIGPQVQVTTSIADDPRVAMTPTGETMVIWSEDGVQGRMYDSLGVPVGPEFTISASGSYPEINVAGPAAFVVVWEGPSGPTGRLFDTTGTAASSELTTTSGDGYNPDVAADAAGNFVMVWMEGGYEWRAQRWQVEAPTPTDIPLLGKVMVVSNKIPDDFEKSKGKWKAAGESIVVPLRGSADDPRCNGDADGTVKASARFVSATSGEDTGAIPLPCQNWTVTGSTKVNGVAKRGYKYSDGKREDGPCNSVKITGTKSVSVSCKGKPGAASFSYDLTSGVSQGSMLGSLSLGNVTYCAEFAPFFDGSDGKKFKGKSIATPANCS